MLQAGLRVGEMAALQVGNTTLRDRSGTVRIRHGKGLKARDVPLKARVRRALQQHLDRRPMPNAGAPLFASNRRGAMPVLTVQTVMTRMARRVRLKRLAVSAHMLRHTFALGFLRDNLGKLVELASLPSHGSLDTTVIYTRPSRDDLAANLKRSHLNVDGSSPGCRNAGRASAGLRLGRGRACVALEPDAREPGRGRRVPG